MGDWQCDATVAHGHQVDLSLDGLAECFVALPRLVFAAGVVKCPQVGRQDSYPIPLPPYLADLFLGHGVFPHEGRHCGDEQDLLGDVPAAQDLQVQVAGEAVQHARHVLGVEGSQHKQVGPLAVLGHLGVGMIAMLPLWLRGALGVVAVPRRLEGGGRQVVGGREVKGGDDLERDMLDAVQAGSNPAGEFEGRGVCQGEQDVERALLRHGDRGWGREV